MEQQTTQVLVVDDNPEIRDIIHVLLEGEGIRVTGLQMAVQPFIFWKTAVLI